MQSLLLKDALLRTYLTVKYIVGLKMLLQKDTSEPVFYGDLVYNLNQIVGKPSFRDQFKISSIISKEWDIA